MSEEIIFDLADTIYFDFIDTLDNKTRAKFIIKDIDNKDGTRNTEKGRELYYLIEDRIKKAFNKLPSYKKIKLELINQAHKDMNGKLRTELTFIKEYCEDEMKEPYAVSVVPIPITDGTADICKGRQEFAEGLLGQINKMNNNK